MCLHVVDQHPARLQVRIMGPNYVPGSKKDLYVKVCSHLVIGLMCAVAASISVVP
jgi:hypothetical protein